MGRWVWVKLQQWLVLIVGLAAIVAMIGIGALFQSHPEPPQSVAVVPPVKQDDTPKPMASAAAIAPQAANQTAAAPTGAKQGSEQNMRADSKQSLGTKAEAAAPAAPGPQPAPTTAPNPPAAPAIPHRTAQQPPQLAQSAAPMTHDHAAAPPTVGQSAPAAATQAAMTGDAAAGRQVFQKCRACHSLDAGKNGVGPSLANVVGEKAAAVPGYNFSPAM